MNSLTFRRQMIALFVILQPAISSAQSGAVDHRPWLEKESRDLNVLLARFQPLCERRYLSEIEKIKKPFDAAEAWNKSHCLCVQRFLKFKEDYEFVQVVNLDLSGKLASLPPLPDELAMYLDGFHEVRLECQRDPSYRAPAEAEPPSPPSNRNQKKPQFRSGHGKTPFNLPIQPQKTPAGRN